MSHADSTGLHLARIPKTESSTRTQRGKMVAADATVADWFTVTVVLLCCCIPVHGYRFYFQSHSWFSDKLSPHTERVSAGVDFTCFWPFRLSNSFLFQPNMDAISGTTHFTACALVCFKWLVTLKELCKCCSQLSCVSWEVNQSYYEWLTSELLLLNLPKCGALAQSNLSLHLEILLSAHWFLLNVCPEI